MERKTIKLRKGVRGSHNLLSSFCGARNHGTPSEVHKSVKMFGKTRKNGSSWGHRNMLAWWFYSPLIFKLWGLNSLCWLPTCLLKIYFNEESIKCKLLTLFSNHLSVTYSVCSLWERSESSQREEHQVWFNSGKYEQIFPVVSERTRAFFQAMKRRAEHKHGFHLHYVSTAWHWLQMHILESSV